MTTTTATTTTASNSSCRFCSAPGAFVTPRRTSDCLEENVCLPPNSEGKAQRNPSGSPWPQFRGICTSFIAPRKNYSHEQGRLFSGADQGKLRALRRVICWGGAGFMASYRILFANWRASFCCRGPERNMDAVTGFWDVTSCISCSYGLFNDAARSSGYVVSSGRLIVNNEWESVWKEAGLSCFVVLSRHSPGGREKSTKSLSHDSPCSGRGSKWAPPEYKSKALSLQPTCSSTPYTFIYKYQRFGGTCCLHLQGGSVVTVALATKCLGNNRLSEKRTLLCCCGYDCV
jgi:hypothetical protein